MKRIVSIILIAIILSTTALAQSPYLQKPWIDGLRLPALQIDNDDPVDYSAPLRESTMTKILQLDTREISECYGMVTDGAGNIYILEREYTLAGYAFGESKYPYYEPEYRVKTIRDGKLVTLLNLNRKNPLTIWMYGEDRLITDYEIHGAKLVYDKYADKVYLGASILDKEILNDDDLIKKYRGSEIGAIFEIGKDYTAMANSIYYSAYGDGIVSVIQPTKDNIYLIITHKPDVPKNTTEKSFICEKGVLNKYSDGMGKFMIEGSIKDYDRQLKLNQGRSYSRYNEDTGTLDIAYSFLGRCIYIMNVTPSPVSFIPLDYARPRGSYWFNGVPKKWAYVIGDVVMTDDAIYATRVYTPQIYIMKDGVKQKYVDTGEADFITGLCISPSGSFIIFDGDRQAFYEIKVK